jgi:putative transcriptional regulator
MVRLRLRQVLKERRKTAYWLARETGISTNTVYRLASKSGRFHRIEARSLDLICKALGCEPGELFERVRS